MPSLKPSLRSKLVSSRAPPVQKKKKEPTEWSTLLYAGARTRTWSLLVRSQTLYPVGLHPHWCPKYSIIGLHVKGFSLNFLKELLNLGKRIKFRAET